AKKRRATLLRGKPHAERTNKQILSLENRLRQSCVTHNAIVAENAILRENIDHLR
ncbi:hypothetical protein KIPB_016104, partial [Kipferlia bialata]